MMQGVWRKHRIWSTSLESGINEISDQLFILDKAYIRYKSQNYVSFAYNNASFTQRINVKKTGMKAAAVLAFMVGLNSLRKVRKNRKGIKKSEKVWDFAISETFQYADFFADDGRGGNDLPVCAGKAAIYSICCFEVHKWRHKDGYAPDGSDLDVNEIYSSTVIAQAMDSLGASGRLSTVRSNCSVTPIISEEQERITMHWSKREKKSPIFPGYL